mgnify:CR=1 FL=1
MTKTFDNTNRGSVWGNKDKKNENSATHQGRANITLCTTNLDNDPKGYNTVDNIEKYLIRNGSGDITGIKVDVFVNAWTRKVGASEKAPAMSFSSSTDRCRLLCRDLEFFSSVGIEVVRLELRQRRFRSQPGGRRGAALPQETRADFFLAHTSLEPLVRQLAQAIRNRGTLADQGLEGLHASYSVSALSLGWRGCAADPRL